MARLKPPRWLAPVLIILFIAGVVAADRLLRQPDRPVLALACADLRAGCAGSLDGRPVTVGVTGELKVLAPFEVWLKMEGIGKAQASFTMEGMDMGFNLYTLRPGPDGVLRARVTLPVCVSGRRDWVMTLEIDGNRLAIPFVTEL